MKRLVLWCAAIMATVVLGSAGAYFTSQAKVVDNVVSAGNVAVSAEPTSGALSVPALSPGASVTKPLTVSNDGDMPVNVVVTAVKTAGITDFWNSLACTVTCDGTSLYAGPLSALRTSPLAIAPATRSSLQFTIGLPDSVGNDLTGDYAKFTAYVDAEQVH